MRHIKNEIKAIKKFNENADKHFHKLGNTVSSLKYVIDSLTSKQHTAQETFQRILSEQNDAIQLLTKNEETHCRFINDKLTESLETGINFNKQILDLLSKINPNPIINLVHEPAPEEPIDDHLLDEPEINLFPEPVAPIDHHPEEPPANVLELPYQEEHEVDYEPEEGAPLLLHVDQSERDLVDDLLTDSDSDLEFIDGPQN